jgi:nicotinate phosphoribosyltransferase
MAPKGFLKNAPDWLAGWTGIRIDSGDPAKGAETAIRWWQERGEDPREKLVIFSDGLDVDRSRRCTPSSRPGEGVLRLGHDADQRFPRSGAGDALAPFSLVCKALSANGRPTVKLSDNPAKAMGPKDEIERYKRVFGVGAQEVQEVVV